MVQPLHRNNLITPTRCHPMLVQSFGDWSVFKQIFSDRWELFQRAHPRYQTSYYDGLVAKMLGCGNPEQMGYVEYRCLHCGQGKPLVSMSCKSSLCLRCAKVYVDNEVSQVSQMLHWTRPHHCPTQLRRVTSPPRKPSQEAARLPNGWRPTHPWRSCPTGM